MHPTGTLLSLRVQAGGAAPGGFSGVQRNPGPHWSLQGGFGASAGVCPLGKAGSRSPGRGRAGEVRPSETQRGLPRMLRIL